MMYNQGYKLKDERKLWNTTNTSASYAGKYLTCMLARGGVKVIVLEVCYQRHAMCVWSV